MRGRSYRRKVHRLGNRYANVFLVEVEKFPEGVRGPVVFWAIEDELFIEP